MLVISIIILFILSFQVIPVALGIDTKKEPFFQAFSGVLFLVSGQLLLFLLGIWLGNRFMHLLEGIKNYVLFIGFFLIAVRFSMEAFKVRKGERTYVMTKGSTYILPAIAQGINTFLAGVLFFFLPTSLAKEVVYLAFFALSFSVLFALLKNKRLAYPAVSLLYLFAGGTLMAISFYFLFM